MTSQAVGLVLKEMADLPKLSKPAEELEFWVVGQFEKK